MVGQAAHQKSWAGITAELSDRKMGKVVWKEQSNGLSKIDQNQLPRKYKVWCYKYTLLTGDVPIEDVQSPNFSSQ